MKKGKSESKAAAAVVKGLERLLADSYTLYLQTHNFHWNVTGPQFQSLHALFEQQYTELALAVDEVAERIRTLGALAPGTYAEFAALTSIKEKSGKLKAREMLETLIEGQNAVIEAAKAALPLAQAADDEASVDLLVGRIQVHEKNRWMLGASLD